MPQQNDNQGQNQFRRARAGPMPPDRQEEYAERRIKTRRAVAAGREFVYGADVETIRISTDPQNPETVTEEHHGSAQAACGCLIMEDARPRFHRDGTLVCQNHYYFCQVCTKELLPLDLVIVEKRVYCKKHGEETIDEILWTEQRNPGTFDRALVAHLKVQKTELRNRRWSQGWNRFLDNVFRRRALNP